MSDLTERVKDVIAGVIGMEESELTLESSLQDSGLDSLDFTEIAMELEEEFDITIPDTAFEQVKTVGDIVKIVTDLNRKSG